MVDQLQYESPIDLQQLPKLDISGGDPILILRPLTPRWLYLFFLIFSIAQFCAFCVLSLFFIRVLRSFPLPFGRMPRDLKLIFIGQLASIAFWLLESVWFGAWSFRQYQMGLTPRKLWISNGSIHLNRAGNWRVSTKTRDLQSIREIRLKPIKVHWGHRRRALNRKIRPISTLELSLQAEPNAAGGRSSTPIWAALGTCALIDVGRHPCCGR